MSSAPEPAVDALLCTRCGGRCCQGHPGVWVDPGRFYAAYGPELPREPAALAQALAAHELVLRDLGGVPVPAPHGTASGCSFLTPQGCRLAPDRRPCQCLALVPVLDTLLDDRIHCELPPASGSNTARHTWAAFWGLAID